MPITAAPRTRGWRSSAARTSSGRTLKPPRMMASSARPRIQTNPSASIRARSVVRIHSLPRELTGLHLEEAFLVDERRSAAFGVDDAQLAARVRAPDAAALRRPELLMVGEVPTGDAAAELGRGVRHEHRDAVLLR